MSAIHLYYLFDFFFPILALIGQDCVIFIYLFIFYF